MLRMYNHITVGNYSFNYVNEFTQESSYDLFTEGCTIKIPAKLVLGGKYLKLNNDIFHRGDRVTVRLGYFPELVTVFTGYVNKVIPDYQFTLECENEMWVIKKSIISKLWVKPKLQKLIDDVLELVQEQTRFEFVKNIDAEPVGITTTLGDIRIKNGNAVQVLDYLKRTYGIYSFVKNGKLRVGLAYYPSEATTHNLSFQRNIISSNLEYRSAENTPVGVKAVSILQDLKTQIEEFVGDANGDIITLHYYNLSREDLRATAERELPKYRFTGYYGSFTTFGRPYIQHGDIVSLTDERFPGRDGNYIVKSVSRTFGQSGYRQQVELSFKV